MKQKKNHKQRGIVLLTCMVFLLVLLALLRFTMTSARVGEQKVGIDLEIVTARESAQSALNTAEQEILRIASQDYCQNVLNGEQNQNNTDCVENASKYAGELFGNLQMMNRLLRSNSGIVTINELNQCTPNQPSWTCVDWSSNEARNALSGNKNITPRKINAKQEYIVERFLTSELSSNATQATKIEKNKTDTVVLRITALGTGNSPASDDQNSSRSIVQATYILPNAKGIDDPQ